MISQNTNLSRLFDNIARNYTDFATYSEPSFDYLNRSSRPEINIVRNNLEVWYNRYPLDKRKDIYSRFRSSKDHEHRSAFFELCLHELMLRLGCKIDIHPRLNNKKEKLPDFLVEPPNGNSFYLEAAASEFKPQREKNGQQILNRVYDFLNSQKELLASKFQIGIGVHVLPKKQISPNDIKNFIMNHFNKLDYKNLLDIYDSKQYEAIPRWVYRNDDIHIEITPAPIYPNENKNKVIYCIYTPFHLVEREKYIRAIIKKKAASFGKLNRPYVIAINMLSSFANREDILDALYGNSACHYSFNKANKLEMPKVEAIRIPNGTWIDKTGPIYKRVSAVLVFNNLYPWNFHTASVCLYHNPWAEKPYDSILTLMPQAQMKNFRMVWTEGKSLASIFDLAKEWPQKD